MVSLSEVSQRERKDFLRIVRQFVIYGIGGVAEKIVAFLLLPLYTNYLPPDEYGVLILVMLIGAFLNLVIGGGLHASLLKFYSDASDAAEKASVYSTLVVFVWVATIPVACLVVLGASDMAWCFLGSASHARLIYIMLVCVPLSVTNDLAATCFRAMQRPGAYVIFSMTRFVLSLALNIVFVVGFGCGVEGILWSGVIASGVTAAGVQGVVLKGIGFCPVFRQLGLMLRYGLPLVPFALFELLIHNADKFLVGHFCRPAEVGIYGLANKLGMAVYFFIIMPFERMWTAYVFELYRRPDGGRIFSRVMTYFMVLLTNASLGLALFSREIVRLMSASEYGEAGRLVPVIALAYVFYGSTRIFNGGLLITGATAAPSWLTGLGLAVNLVANVCLIPLWGAAGAAWAALATQAFIAALTFWASQRVYPVQYEWQRILLPLCAACALVLLGWPWGAERVGIALVVHGLLFLAFVVGLLTLPLFRAEEKAAVRAWFFRRANTPLGGEAT